MELHQLISQKLRGTGTVPNPLGAPIQEGSEGNLCQPPGRASAGILQAQVHSFSAELPCFPSSFFQRPLV